MVERRRTDVGASQDCRFSAGQRYRQWAPDWEVNWSAYQTRVNEDESAEGRFTRNQLVVSSGRPNSRADIRAAVAAAGSTHTRKGITVEDMKVGVAAAMGPSMGALITNVLVRLLVADDPVETRRAAAFLEARRPVWISTVVPVETVCVLMTVYRWSKTQMLAMLHKSTNSRRFAFDAVKPVRRAADVYTSTKTDFSDCLALELARGSDTAKTPQLRIPPLGQCFQNPTSPRMSRWLSFSRQLLYSGTPDPRSRSD